MELLAGIHAVESASIPTAIITTSTAAASSAAPTAAAVAAELLSKSPHLPPLAPPPATEPSPPKHSNATHRRSGRLSPSSVSSPRLLDTPSELSSPGLVSPAGPSSRSLRRESSESDLALRSAEIQTVVQRLHAQPMTGQVAAWGWDNAAKLSAVRRAPPVSLLAALWPATADAAPLCTPQDIVEIAESWLTLTQRWPRHFCFSAEPIERLCAVAFPAAVKRLSEQRLVRLTAACRDIALYRVDPIDGLGQRGPSARDILQPIFCLIAAETAWRAATAEAGAREEAAVSPATLRMVLTASAAWRWTAVRHRDSQELLSIKAATRASLDIIRKALN